MLPDDAAYVQECVQKVQDEASVADGALGSTSQDLDEQPAGKAYTWQGDRLQLWCGNGVNIVLPATPGLSG